MKVLAIEFSSLQRSVAVVQGQANAQTPECNEVVETGARATRAFSLIEAALREARVEREQIDCLAVGIGPGSYTGIRAAIAVAQGWQLGREVRILAISSVECLAAQAQEEGLVGRVGMVIDAQRSEFYFAGYEVAANARRELEPLRLMTLGEVQARQQLFQLAGPEVAKWFPSARILFPSAAMLGRLALSRDDFMPGEKVEPIYLRPTAFVKAPAIGLSLPGLSGHKHGP